MAAWRAEGAAVVLGDPVQKGKADFVWLLTLPRVGSWDHNLTAAEQVANDLEPYTRDSAGKQVLGMLTLTERKMQPRQRARNSGAVRETVAYLLSRATRVLVGGSCGVWPGGWVRRTDLLLPDDFKRLHNGEVLHARTSYIAWPMEERGQQLAHLKRLAEALTSDRFTAELVDKGAQPYLKVATAVMPSLNELVACGRAADNSWSFRWSSSQQLIGSANDLELVVSRIAFVLRPVEAGE